MIIASSFVPLQFSVFKMARTGISRLAFVALVFFGSLALTANGALTKTSFLSRLDRRSLDTPTAFTQSSSNAAVSEQLRAQLQEQMMQKLTAQVEEMLKEHLSEMVHEVVNEELDLKNQAKTIFGKLLTQAMSKATSVVGEQCNRLTSIAQDKLHAVDAKLQQIASGDELSAAEIQDASNAAFAQLSEDFDSNGFWGKMKRKWGVFKDKAKKYAKSIAEASKPILAKAASEIMPSLQQHVTAMLGSACKFAESTLASHSEPSLDF